MLKTLIERDRGIASGCRGQYALEPVIRDASEVKFIFADSLDVVDPNYDFTTEQAAESRAHWDKCYPHELMEPAPYDGVLVSRGIVDGKYSSAQALRLRRNGVRKFLRLDGPRFAHMPIYGDSGAFRYCSHDKPPYTAAQMLDFYADGGFTHGCSVDHIVFDFDREESGRAAGSDSARSGRESHLRMRGRSSSNQRRLGSASRRSALCKGGLHPASVMPRRIWKRWGIRT